MTRLIWNVKEKMKYNRRGISNHDKHQILQPQVRPTHMMMLPNGIPAHSSDEVAWHMAGSCLKVGLNGQEIISNWQVDAGQHGVRLKLEEWVELWSVGLNNNPLL